MPPRSPSDPRMLAQPLRRQTVVHSPPSSSSSDPIVNLTLTSSPDAVSPTPSPAKEDAPASTPLQLLRLSKLRMLPSARQTGSPCCSSPSLPASESG